MFLILQLACNFLRLAINLFLSDEKPEPKPVSFTSFEQLGRSR